MTTRLPDSAFLVERIKATFPIEESDDSQTHTLVIDRHMYDIPSGVYEYITVMRDGSIIWRKRYSGRNVTKAHEFMADSRADLGNWVTL